ncbi:PTS system, D-glucosamine-specific IIC component/PTS system, maltose and glucose-specific IIC component [Pelagirhabdus alkalitolerans]|uniref:PTS system, D-glucosamine-specific IIC component/PTS system, maltose and glucose-specific IIC component n=1 Tax=Pelagirhabdus alkalitolerans TaxID=1612202 RepID=A0A1G6KFC6_9BACI|nr:PTS transporter subunit EIIC [Pelagirhabdus alkalitolerans]SDC29664.1 PTS system, D-glucosamine-specific IIC component/PTS system, maltose and glucose-specific IIC component [Pelagirhabdus alkalitolerans]
MKDFFQKLGKSLMMPISIIAAAGIFLGLASVLQNPDIVGETFVSFEGVQNVIGFVRSLSGSLFGNLPILFAVSIAIGMARKEKPTAAFSAVIGFIIFHVTLEYILGLNGVTAETTSIDYLMAEGMSELEATQVNSQYETVLGIFTLRMNVFAGILAGGLVAILHNKFYNVELPVAISFFGGKRFVPIITTVAVPVLSLAMYYIWPFVGGAIESLGNVIADSGLFGTFLFGFLERLLIPTGLHHILNQLVRFTPIGGIAMIDGDQVVGALNIFNTALAQDVLDFDLMSTATRFLAQGKVPFMVFGLPAAGFAMINTARLGEKKRVKGLLFAAILAAFTTGITEPIEFAFIFVSPLLFVFHAFMAGLSFMLMDLFNVVIGNVQGGVIDLTVFGVLQGTATNWFFAVIVGIGYAFAYYYFFKFIITKKNIQTPGREKLDEGQDVEVKDDGHLGETIVEALGGVNNIEEIENCFTRLRLVVKDANVADEQKLKNTGAAGVVKIDDKHIQVIYGPQVEGIAQKVKGVPGNEEK